MIKAAVAMEIASTASKHKCPHTPPEPPGQEASPHPLTVDHRESLFLKIIKAKSRNSTISEAPEAVGSVTSGGAKTEEDVDEKFQTRTRWWMKCKSICCSGFPLAYRTLVQLG